MSETRKLAAILVSDVVGYSRLAGADEDRTLARLRALRSDLIDPTIAAHHGRIVKRTGDGSIIEFRSVVDAVRCAIEVQTGMVERNAGLPPERASSFASAFILATWSRRATATSWATASISPRGSKGICEPGGDLSFRGRLPAGQVAARAAGQPISGRRPNSRTSPSRSASIRCEVGQPAQAKPAATVAAPARAPPAPKARGLRCDGRRSPPRSLSRFSRRAPSLWRAGYAPRFMAASVDDKLANAPRLSIVVLPFENLSGDKEQDYFADGITDDLTTDLSHLPDSFVIARNTAFTYKGKPVDAKQIGRELGVRYLLEGSVRRVGETITVNAQLISTETGAHVWADRFDGERSKLGELQVEFVSRLANSLGVELVKAEALRAMRERPNNPDAVDLAMRGRRSESNLNPEQGDFNDVIGAVRARACSRPAECAGDDRPWRML